MTTLNDTEIEVNAFSASLDEIQNQIETFVEDMKTMSNELKFLKKRYLKIVKTIAKTKKKLQPIKTNQAKWNLPVL